MLVLLLSGAIGVFVGDGNTGGIGAEGVNGVNG
jgi:hypothetical protein